MKRLCAFLLALLLSCTVALAQETESTTGSSIDELLAGGEIDEITQVLPPTAKEQLPGGGEDIRETVESLQPQNLMERVVTLIKNAITQPIKILVSLCGIMVLAAMMEVFQTTLSGGQVQRIFQVVVAVAVASVILGPLVQCIQDTARVLGEFALFITTYIPVLAGVMTAAGQPLTAMAYNVFLFWICQITSQLISSYFVPLLCAYLALTVISVVCPSLELGKLVSGIKTFVTWGLTLTLTVFVGLLSVQSVVASGGDHVTTRAAKFMIGSLVPGVGGALSDLFMAARGCIQLAKSTLGAFGVVVTLFTFLPSLVQVLLWYLSLQISSLVGSILGVRELAGLTKSIASTVGVMLAVLLYDALLVIISTTIIIVTFRAG